MFRSLFWLTAGVILGLWGRRKAIDTVERKVPEPVRRNTSRALKEVASFVSDIAASRESARRAAATPPPSVRDISGYQKD